MNDQASQLRDRILHRHQTAKTIAVISGKGGVGKSNVVLNFSIELLKLGRKVLIIDLDIGMGNIDVLLGQTSRRTILDLFNTNIPINDMIEKGPKDLHYISGASSLNELFELSDEKLTIFLNRYQKLTEAYDYIFFDMGAGVTSSSLSFVLAADECILVTTPEPTSITDAYSMMKQIFLHQSEMEMHIVMNQSPSRIEGEKALYRLVNVVEHFLSKKVYKLGTLPHDSVVSSAVIRQVPYVLLKPNAPISKAVQKLAKQFDTGISNTAKQPSTFVMRLKSFFRTKGTE